MAEFERQYNSKFEESDSEYFFSRRASMDEFSDCAAGTSPALSTAYFTAPGFNGSINLANSDALSNVNYDNNEDIDYSCTTEGDSPARTLAGFGKSFLGQQEKSSSYSFYKNNFGLNCTDLKIVDNNVEMLLDRHSSRSSFAFFNANPLNIQDVGATDFDGSCNIINKIKSITNLIDSDAEKATISSARESTAGRTVIKKTSPKTARTPVVKSRAQSNNRR